MLPKIEGLQMVEGLARLGHNHRLYARLLLNFAGQGECILESLRSALEARNINRLRLQAGKLKMTAGALGARAVQQSASRLETAQVEALPQQFQALSHELGKLCYLIPQRMKTWTSVLDRGFRPLLSLPQLQEKLEMELQNFDGEALVSWSEFSTRMVGRLPSGDLEKLEALVLNLDFPDVLDALQKLRAGAPCGLCA